MRGLIGFVHDTWSKDYRILSSDYFINYLPMLSSVRPFRYAASIILASSFRRQGAVKNGSFDESPLLVHTVKRSPSASFMPSTVVFPGGALDETDFHPDYALGYTEACLRESESWRKWHSEYPPLPAYTALRQLPISQKMPPERALRICALRELFEECGILIGYSLTESRYITMDAKKNPFTDDAVDTWEFARQRVREDATNFRDFCIDRLRVVPAFWLLAEWANWLAPNVYKQRSRFDGMFYLCFLEEMPQAVVHDQELETGQWESPSRVLMDNADGRVPVAPPQWYELATLAKYHSLKELRLYAEERRMQITRMFPHLVATADDRRLVILPGDDLYPKGMDENAAMVPLMKMQDTLLQSRSKCKNFHRMEFDALGGKYTNGKINMTLSQPFGNLF